MIHYFAPPTMTERIRTTISLSPEVYEIFRTMAETSGTSVSRCMGDWLADTAEGAQFLAYKIQQLRNAPTALMRGQLEREIEDWSLGDTTKADLSEWHDAPLGGALARRAGRPPSPVARKRAVPPSSNTGVLVPPSPPHRPASPRGKK